MIVFKFNLSVFGHFLFNFECLPSCHLFPSSLPPFLLCFLCDHLTSSLNLPAGLHLNVAVSPLLSLLTSYCEIIAFGFSGSDIWVDKTTFELNPPVPETLHPNRVQVGMNDLYQWRVSSEIVAIAKAKDFPEAYFRLTFLPWNHLILKIIKQHIARWDRHSYPRDLMQPPVASPYLAGASCQPCVCCWCNLITHLVSEFAFVSRPQPKTLPLWLQWGEATHVDQSGAQTQCRSPSGCLGGVTVSAHCDDTRHSAPIDLPSR